MTSYLTWWWTLQRNQWSFWVSSVAWACSSRVFGAGSGLKYFLRLNCILVTSGWALVAFLFVLDIISCWICSPIAHCTCQHRHLRRDYNTNTNTVLLNVSRGLSDRVSEVIQPVFCGLRFAHSARRMAKLGQSQSWNSSRLVAIAACKAVTYLFTV